MKEPNRSTPSRALLAGAALSVAVGLAACGDDDKTKFSKSKTLKFTEQPSDDFGFADNPPKTQLGPQGPRKLSNGDQVTFSSKLLDRSRRTVGELDVACSVTRAGGFDKSRQQCAGTATLPGGVLTLARGGRVFGGDSTSGAIVGGTGAYAGATGHFTEAEQKAARPTTHFASWSQSSEGPRSSRSVRRGRTVRRHCRCTRLPETRSVVMIASLDCSPVKRSQLHRRVN